MAINFLNTVDLNSIQIENIVPENATAGTIGGGVLGQIYFDTVQDTMMQYVADSDGAGNPGYIEIGTTSGVETFSNTNVGSTYVDFSVVNASAIGDVNIGFADLNAVDGTSTAADRFLTKANKWATIPFGDITAVLPGTYINVDDSTGPEPTINHDLTTRTDTTSTASPGYGATFTTIDTVTTNTTGHITALNVKTVTLAADTIYTLPVTALAGNQARVSLTPSVGAVTSTVDFIGTAGRIAITSQDQNNGSVTIDFPTNVEIAGTLDTVGKIAVAGTALSTFAGQVQIVGATAGNTNNAVTLGQLNTAVAGIGVFQGGYNVATNTPALTGGSNVALDQGDFFVVTTGGTFYTVTLEIGDFIFAAADIAASSSPTVSEYTIVRADANLAGLSADEPSAIRGVAGFDSAYFTADAGWISLNRQTNANGAKQALNDTAPSERTFLNGLTTFEINLADTSLFGANALAENVTVEVTQNASPYQTVYADVTRSGSAAISVIFSGNVAVDIYRVLLTHI
jgi:hypothetical protein